MIRDTDADWDQIAKAHPYYGVLTHERFRNPNDENLKEFFGTGEHDIQHHAQVIRREFGYFAPTTALDFGCGVGRLLIPIAKRTGYCYGVDIADEMLRLAVKHCSEAGVTVELGKAIPIGRQFDWVNSIVVLQHIPPARGYAIIRSLWEAVAPDGCLTLHVTIYKNDNHVSEIDRDFRIFAYDGESVSNYTLESSQDARMSMYDYNLSRIMSCFDLPDGAATYMEKTVHGACHGFRIYVRKGPAQHPAVDLGYDSKALVAKLYDVVLGRTADEGGLAFWSNFLDTGGRPDELLSIFANSEENKWRAVVSYARRGIGFGEADIDFLESWKQKDLVPTPGFVTDFIGCKTRISSLWRGCEILDGTVYPLPVPGDFQADTAEWLGTLKAVAAAEDSMSVMELGAGMGPWLAAAGVAARNRGVDDLYLCGVEGDRGRLALLCQHLADNGLDKVPQYIVNAAVGVADGTAWWPVLNDPANQSGARPMRDGEESDHLYLKQHHDLGSMIEVEVIAFSRLLAIRPLWDLIHIDVQGTEVELCQACLPELKQRARYLVIGTHSRKLDGDLVDLFYRDGWILEHERPCSMKYRRHMEDLIHCSTADGTQVWRNPDL